MERKHVVNWFHSLFAFICGRMHMIHSLAVDRQKEWKIKSDGKEVVGCVASVALESICMANRETNKLRIFISSHFTDTYACRMNNLKTRRRCRALLHSDCLLSHILHTRTMTTIAQAYILNSHVSVAAMHTRPM